MTKYKIIPDGLKSYGVETVSEGRFRFVGGFATELEAAAWIAEQQAREAAVVAAKRSHAAWRGLGAT